MDRSLPMPLVNVAIHNFYETTSKPCAATLGHRNEPATCPAPSTGSISAVDADNATRVLTAYATLSTSTTTFSTLLFEHATCHLDSIRRR